MKNLLEWDKAANPFGKIDLSYGRSAGIFLLRRFQAHGPRIFFPCPEAVFFCVPFLHPGEAD